MGLCSLSPLTQGCTASCAARPVHGACRSLSHLLARAPAGAQSRNSELPNPEHAPQVQAAAEAGEPAALASMPRMEGGGGPSAGGSVGRAFALASMPGMDGGASAAGSTGASW